MDVVVDSSVIAKWILPQADSSLAQQVLSDVTGRGDRLLAVDLALPEVASAIWKRLRQKAITPTEADSFLDSLLRAPVATSPTTDLIKAAYPIAVRYDRAIHDALFVALAASLSLPGVTADEPLYNVVKSDFPRIILLRDWT